MEVDSSDSEIDPLPIEATESNIQDHLVLDSLPYIDEYSSEAQKMAQHLIQVELAAHCNKDFPEFQPILESDSEFLKNELERISSSRKVESALRPSDFVVSAPPTFSTLEEWKTALDQSKIRHEYLRNQHQSLELSLIFGSDAWIRHNSSLEKFSKNLDASLEEIQKKLDQVNLKRKSEQVLASAKLARYDEWVEIAKKMALVDYEKTKEVMNLIYENEITNAKKS